MRPLRSTSTLKTILRFKFASSVLQISFLSFPSRFSSAVLLDLQLRQHSGPRSLRQAGRLRPTDAMGWKAAQKLFKHWRVLRGDNIMIMGGKDKGATGKVTQVLRSKNKVIVEGKNLLKKHIRRRDDTPGGIVTMESPIHVSKLQHIDPVTNAPCRVIFRYLEDGTKVRVTTGGTSSGSIIPRPDILKERRTLRPITGGPKDTAKEDVLERTYDPITGNGGLPELPPKRVENPV